MILWEASGNQLDFTAAVGVCGGYETEKKKISVQLNSQQPV